MLLCPGKMRSQLASVLVIAAVACGGRGEEEPAGPVDGTTDTSPTEGLVAADDDLTVDDDVDARPAIEDAVPIEGSSLRARPTPDPDRVEAATAVNPKLDAWRARAPQRYVISTCGYGFGPPSCSVEAVEEGRLVSRSNRFLPGEPWQAAPIDDGQEPVASLFDEAERSIDGCTTSFQLDPVYAYPSQVYFDCGEEGWGVQVTCFEPDTLDASRCQ